MTKYFKQLRREYSQGPLNDDQVEDDPLNQFKKWLQLAKQNSIKKFIFTINWKF